MANSEGLREPYIQELHEERERYMGILEELFGPRDPRFVFQSFQRSTRPDGNPRNYLHGGGQVDIEISWIAWDEQRSVQSRWQLAHECVHLLEPKLEHRVTWLEEGIATWFQCERQYHVRGVSRYIKYHMNHQALLLPNYKEARAMVVQHMNRIAPMVKAIRAEGRTISDIDTATLEANLGPLDAQVADRLCSVF